jgi:hypothetical protein
MNANDRSKFTGWPDPKYVDVWQQRGWLQTTNIHPG